MHSQSTHVSILICQELLFFSFPVFCLKTASHLIRIIYIYVYLCIIIHYNYIYICMYKHTHIHMHTNFSLYLERPLFKERKKKKICLNRSPFNQLQECCTNYFPTGWPFHLLMAFWNKIALTRWECYVCHISNSIFSLVGTE